MKNYCPAFISLILLLSLSSCSNDNNKKLTGTYKDNIGFSQITFVEDKFIMSSLNGESSGSYVFDGNELEIFYSGGDLDGKSDTYTYNSNNDTLDWFGKGIMVFSKASKTPIEVPPESVPSEDDLIVGKWRSYAIVSEDGITDTTALTCSFKSDGTFKLSFSGGDDYSGTWTTLDAEEIDLESAYNLYLDDGGRMVASIDDSTGLSIGIKDSMVSFRKLSES